MFVTVAPYACSAGDVELYQSVAVITILPQCLESIVARESVKVAMLSSSSAPTIVVTPLIDADVVVAL